MFSSPEDWHYRHAALMAISAVGEGCEKQMTPILGEVVAAVLPFCQDQVRREGEWEGGGGRESGREVGWREVLASFKKLAKWLCLVLIPGLEHAF